MPSRLIRPALLATLAALTVAGCSSGAEPTVASAGGAASAGSGSPDDVAAYLAGQQAFVDCMRDAGFDYSDPDSLGEFEDLDPSEPGDPDYKSPNSPEQLAQDACAAVLLPAPASIQEALTPPMTDEQEAQWVEYATCMQSSGVPDYPDFDGTSPSDPAQVTDTSTLGLDDPDYAEAMDSCSESVLGIEPGSAVG